MRIGTPPLSNLHYLRSLVAVKHPFDVTIYNDPRIRHNCRWEMCCRPRADCESPEGDTSSRQGSINSCVSACDTAQHFLGGRNRIFDVFVAVSGGHKERLVLAAWHVNAAINQAPEVLRE